MVTTSARQVRLFPMLGACLFLVLAASAFPQDPGPNEAKKQPEQPPSPPRQKQDMPTLRERWFYEQRAYPQGFIPADARLKALRRLEEMERAEATKGGNGQVLGAVPPPPANGTTWTSIGPQPVRTPFWGNVSGRLSAVAVHPTNPDIVYVGGAQGGVWKSTDAGATWTALGDREVSLAIGAIAIDPANPNTVYVGTGEQTNSSASYYGAGILKSVDGGSTWTQLGQAVFAGPFNPGSLGGGSQISSLAIHPANPNIILAGVRIVPFVSDGGSSSGVYCSNDAGLTWMNVLPGAAGSEVVFDVQSPGIAYAALGSTSGDSDNGVYKTTSAGLSCAQQAGTWLRADTGASRLPTASVGRIEIAIAPSTTGPSAVLYASIENFLTDGILGIFRSADAGINWNQLFSAPNHCTPQCWYDHVIRVHPTNANVVFAGGSAVADYLTRTTDGGVSWIRSVSGTNAVVPHVDIQSMAFVSLPGGGARLYMGNDGGIWRTDLASSADPPNWINLNGDGTNPGTALSLSQYYPGHSIDPSNLTIGYGGTQDNGTQKFTNDFTWQFLLVCGDGGFTAIDPDSPTTIYAACQRIDVNKSTNAGTSFQAADNGITPGERGAFIPPLVIDPNPSFAPFTTRPLYFGTFRIWQTLDGATNWSAISPDLTSGIGTIRAIAIAPSDSRVVYAGTSDGRIQRTLNAELGPAAAWTNLTTNDLPTRLVTWLAVNSTDPNVAYAAFSGFSGFSDSKGHVFKTTNGGASWTDISSAPISSTPLPNTPANVLILDPDVPGTIYIGTDVGVFVSANDGVNWSPLMTGLPRVTVLGLALHRPTRTLRAGTHGRGMWDLRLTNFNPAFILSSISPTATNAGSPDVALTVTGNGFTPSSVVRFNGTGLTTTCATANQCTATIPAASMTTGVAAQIAVFEPSAPAPGTTNSLVFSVTNPIPTLLSISPVQAADGGPAFTLTATGTNFLSSSVMQWNGILRTTTFVSATQLTAAIPASDIASPGLARVTVNTPGPGGGTTASRGFSIGTPPVNDNVAAAKIIPGSPYTDTVNNVAATVEPTDPSPPCAPGSNSHSVWYQFSATSTVTGVLVNTQGSPYDTVLSLWTGTPGSFTAVACDDDGIAVGGASQLPPLQLNAGTTYFFMVSGFLPTDAGTTVFNFTIPQDFQLSANPAAITVTRGQSGSSTITVTALGGFNGAVTFACTGLPSLSSCSFNPASVTPGAAPATTTLTITTTAGATLPPLTPTRWPAAPQPGPLLLAAFTLATLLAYATRRRRILRTAFALSAVALLAGMLASCGGGGGGGSTPPPPSPGTTRGTFIVTVTGTSGAISRSATVTLTVN